MPAFGSSTKTGRLPSDEPRRAAGASSSSMGASSRTPSRASSRPLSIPHASTKKERDVRAASRAPKRALAPATPSPSSHTPLTRTRAALLPGRDPPPSARGSEVSPARSPPSGSAEKKKAAKALDEGIAAVRNLLFEDGPKTYCAVDEPPFSVGHDKRGSPTSSPIDPSASPIEAPRVADGGALAFAKTRRIPMRFSFSSRLLPVDEADAATASSTRLAELRLADETWRRVAFRIARAGGTRGDALAASAREVFRRLAAALPPETDEETAFAAREERSRRRDASASASRFSHHAPLLLDCGSRRESDGITAPYRPEVERRTDTGGRYAIDALSRSFVTKSLRRASAVFARVARASLASLAFLALASVVVFAVRDARRRSPARAFQRDAPPPS